ncbi:MAG: 2Fe-2S iron-sulfur cluster binding domain-containing protein [Alphaproteobacteria bacterium]|nr:2Fe-2S iron-sulfur cluster binding domain-containing protein [Alphaproteobacteria bacterium]
MADSAAVTILNTGESYLCPPDVALLDAGLAAGLHIPHSCRGGACGTCKARVVEGTVDHGWVMSFAITDEEKAEGYCLTCQSKPTSARVALRMVNDMVPRAAAPTVVPSEFEATVLAAHRVTPTVMRVVLAVPAGMRFAFNAGQNLEFVVPGLVQPRPYSIVEAPGADGTPPVGQLSFYVTRHDRGHASGWLHDNLRTGDAIQVRGPYGEFHLPAGDGPLFGLAGGTGLSPVLSLMADALAAGFAGPARLMVSVRDRREIFAFDALSALARAYPNFGARFTLTREASVPAPWLSGRITDLLARDRPDLSGARVLIAGAPAFVDAVRSAAITCAAAPASIAVDSFVSRNPDAGR